MFFLASPLISTLGTVGLVGSLAAFVFAVRKRIPHPTEFWIIGCWFRWFGCHKHDAFGLVLDVHTIKGVRAKSKVYLQVIAGRHEATSSVEQAESEGGPNASVDFYQTIKIQVRQCDKVVLVKLWRKSHLKDELLGECKMFVDEQIIGNGFPKKSSWDCFLFDRKTATLHQSLYRSSNTGGGSIFGAVDEEMLERYGALEKIAQQLIIQGIDVDAATLDSMPIDKRMRTMARVVEGDLRRFDNTRATNPWVQSYFRASRNRNNNQWLWCWWPSREAMAQKQNPLGAIPILAITAVIKGEERNERHQFAVRYKATSQDRQIYFQRVDRDRELWVSGILEFLNVVRQDYANKPRHDDGGAVIAPGTPVAGAGPPGANFPPPTVSKSPGAGGTSGKQGGGLYGADNLVTAEKQPSLRKQPLVGPSNMGDEQDELDVDSLLPAGTGAPPPPPNDDDESDEMAPLLAGDASLALDVRGEPQFRR